MKMNYIEAYKGLNPKANKQDNYDIAAVTARDGTKGQGLLSEVYCKNKKA